MKRAIILGLLVAGMTTAAAFALTPGDPIPLNVTTTSNQRQSDLAPLPGGGFVATWAAETVDPAPGEDAIHARRFGSDGSPLDAGEIHVEQNTNNTQNDPAVAAAPDGTFVVVWETYYSDAPGTEVRGRRFAADGSPLTAEFAVNATASGGQETPEIGMAPDGRFVVVWETLSGEVMGRRFNADASPASGDFEVGPGQTNDSVPNVAVETGGGFVVTWTDYSGVSPAGDVLVRRFTADGSPAWAGKAAHDSLTGTQEFSGVVITASGFLVAWMDGGEIRMRPFAADGTPLAPQMTANLGTTGTQYLPLLAVASDGSIGVAWQNFVGSNIRHFDAALSPLTGDVVVDANGYADSLIASGSHFVVSYTGTDSDGEGVFGRRFAFQPVGGGGTPTPDPTASPTPAPSASPTPAPTVTPVVVVFKDVVRLPSAKKCVSRRKFRIRLQHPPTARIVSAVVRVNGKRVATRRGARVTAVVNLKGLPKGRFKVAITVKLSDGRTLKGSRRYRTCTPRRRG